MDKVRGIQLRVKHFLKDLSVSQSNVEKKLDNFMREYKEGRREGSVISTQTAESLSADEKQAWCTIQKELEEIGITVAAFDANKDFIINWFTEAIATGAFEEQISDDDSIMGECEEPLSETIEDSPYGSQDYSLEPSILGVQPGGPQLPPDSPTPNISTATVLPSSSGRPSQENSKPAKKLLKQVAREFNIDK